MRCAPTRGCSSTAKTSAAVRQRVPAAPAAAEGVRRPDHRIPRSPKAACSGFASARRLPGSGRSARCSSTTSSRPGSISWSTTPQRSGTGGVGRCQWSSECPGAGYGMPVHTTAEHRSVVLSHARPEDRGALHAARRPRADGSRGRRSGSGAVLRAHRALSRTANQAGAAGRGACAHPLGRAALRRAGDDLAIVSYGAYVHVAMRVAERLAADGSRRACSTCERSLRSTRTRC